MLEGLGSTVLPLLWPYPVLDAPNFLLRSLHLFNAELSGRSEVPGGGVGWTGGGVGGGVELCLTLHCQHQNGHGIQMGSDESRFMVSYPVRAK